MTLFGPVFYFDLIRESRRRPAALLRLLYLGGMFGLLLLGYFSWSSNGRGQYLAPGQTARFIESFFAIFLAAQFFFVVILTPALTAGAITEEKEGQTLPFLLASSLHNHEIILGKLASRLVSVLLIVLAGLPVFSLLQLLGGVDPGWLAVGFAATGITMLSLASVSVAWSAVLPRSRDAVLFAYISFPAYILLARTSQLLLGIHGWAEFPSTEDWMSPVTLTDVIQGFNAGDPFRAIGRGMDTMQYGSGEGLWEVLRSYLIFHAMVILLALATAVLRVRRVALAAGNVRKKDRARQRLRSRPPVGDQPVVWREMYAERGAGLHWLARLVLIVLIGLSFLPAFYILGDQPFGSRRYQTELMNAWVRIVGTLVASLLLLAVAVRAATSITSEKQKQTFDILLTTPLELDDIQYGKWKGSVLSIRWGWLWLGAILGLGLITGGVSLLALPLLALAWCIYAAALAALGLWFSLRARSTLRAVVQTVMTVVGLWLGPWLLLSCCAVLGSLRGEGPLKLLTGLTPPSALALLCFSNQELSGRYNGVYEYIGYAIGGLFVWGGFVAIVWSAARQQFLVLTGRARQPLADLRASVRQKE